MKKHFERATAQHLSKFMQEHDKNQVELAEALGVSNGSISGWITRNDAPRISVVAVEGLQRRMKGSEGFQGELIASLEREIKELKDGQAADDGAAQRQPGKQYIPQIEEMILQLMDLKYDLKYGHHVEPG